MLPRVEDLTPRERGKAVYRALQAAGWWGLKRRELQEVLGWDGRSVLETIVWLRQQRVSIRVDIHDDICSWDRKARFILDEPVR